MKLDIKSLHTIERFNEHVQLQWDRSLFSRMRIPLKAFCKIIADSFKSLKSPMKTLSRKSEAEIFLGSSDRHLLWQQLPRGAWRGRLKRQLCEGYVSENHKEEGEEGKGEVVQRRGKAGWARLLHHMVRFGNYSTRNKHHEAFVTHRTLEVGQGWWGDSGKPAVWLVFIFTYLVFSAAASALLSFCLPWRARKLG